MASRRSGAMAMASQGAGPSRRNDDSEGESDDGAYEDRRATQGGTQAGRGGLSDADINSKATVIVRYALVNEYKRRTMPRSELAKLVNAPKGFGAVFAQAQSQLKSVFGMELVEVRSKQKIGKHGELLNPQPEAEKGKGKKRRPDAEGDDEETQTQTKKSAGPPKQYILRSILPPALLAGMSQPRPMPSIQYDDDGIQPNDEVPDSGSLIRWEQGDGTPSGHVALLGIRAAILCLVLCMGRVIEDDHLHALLRRLNLHRDTVLPYASTDSKAPPMTLEKYLELLDKQRYLERTIIADGHVNEERPQVEWRWGSREAEFSENAAAAFIEKIFFDRRDGQDSESEDEQDGRDGRTREDREEQRAAKRKKVKEDVAKAAGGPLEGML